MEFLCLNCFETFDVDEKKLPAPGEMLTCPVCGHKQPFAGVKTKRTTTASHRRASGEYHMSSGNTDAPGLRKTTTTIKGKRPRAKTRETVEVVPEDKSATYNVVSPSGLSFEFPDLHMLVRWGEMVANPVPYQVYSKGKEGAVSLDEILNDKSSIRKFKRRTMKMQQAAEAVAVATGVSSADNDEEPNEPNKSARPLSTREFKFKTEVVEEKKWPMLIIYLILSALFGAAALFAFYVYFMHGSGK